MQRFTELDVWKRSHALALVIYKLTTSLPSDERFGLTSQLRRAAVSVAANIAEGSKRRGKNEYARFLNIAEGSLAEVECLLFLSRDLKYLSAEQITSSLQEASEIARMLNALRVKVEKG
jgi:four helix bundle protein